jgi:hypothetical protein
MHKRHKTLCLHSLLTDSITSATHCCVHINIFNHNHTRCHHINTVTKSHWVGSVDEERGVERCANKSAKVRATVRTPLMQLTPHMGDGHNHNSTEHEVIAYPEGNSCSPDCYSHVVVLRFTTADGCFKREQQQPTRPVLGTDWLQTARRETAH